jgi:hypothetical protein
MPPIRCSSPGVPGLTHGRARVAASRRYGKKPSFSARKWTSIGGSVFKSGISHGSEPLARNPSLRTMTGTMYLAAIRTAS